MGCSASRPDTKLITKTHNPSEDPFSVSSSQYSYSSPQVSRAFSLPTPLVHHPPLRKGDTHHLVSLTSTTYGSLSLIDTAHKTPVQDDSPIHEEDHQDESLSPDSVINTWELMDGLDDDDGCGTFDLGKPKSLFTTRTKELPSITKPLWKHLSEESLLSKLDPNVVSSYRRALSSRQLVSSNNEIKSTISSCSSLSDSWFKVPSPTTETRSIVLYFTSLRGIRKTYEDCCCVKMIFRGFRVAVDERDISMDSMYRNELQSFLGAGKIICLPQVFINGKHTGGVEEIKQLNESGELGKILEGFPIREAGIVCEGCGDARFVPCPNCNGSRKVFEEDEARLRRCPDCNENGLIRCPACCSS